MMASRDRPQEPTDSDVDLSVPAHRWALAHGQLPAVAAVSVGAPLRYLTDRAVQARHDTVFPWGTFTVNVIGCLMLGLTTGVVTYGAASSGVQLLVGTGLGGALTTYSTFSHETLRLAETGARFFAAANAAASVIGGLGAVFAGAALAQALWA